MKDKREKIQLFRELARIYVDKDCHNDFDALKKILTAYRELYVKPYFGAFGKHLAPLKFDDTPPAQTIENNISYEIYTKDNIVTIYLGVLDLYKDKFEKMSYNPFILLMVSGVGHEYEHNFQWKGGEVAKKLAKDKEKYRAEINSATSKFAYEIAEGLDPEYYLENQKDNIRALLELTNSWDEFSKTESKDKIVEDCAQAVYLNRYLEIDARAAERKIFETFVKDAEKLSNNETFVRNLKSVLEVLGEAEKIYQGTETGLHGYNYNLYLNVLEKLEKSNYEYFINYAKCLTQAMNEEYTKQLLDYDESGKLLLQEDYVYGQFYRDVLIKAFCFLTDMSKDKTAFSNHINTDKMLDFELALLKFGVPIGDYLFTQEFTYAEGEKESFLEKYFEMLKKGDITFESFSRVSELSLGQQKELLTTYISRKQTEFVTNMLCEVDSDELETLLAGEPGSKDENIVDQIGKRLYGILLDLENSRQSQDGKSINYDDINDMINMLANICQMRGVPFYDATPDLQSSIKSGQDFDAKLLELYMLAEKLGYEAVCQIKGSEPRPDAYRFAHAQDRERYIISGEDAKFRRQKIYGSLAVSRDEEINNMLNCVDSMLDERNPKQMS